MLYKEDWDKAKERLSALWDNEIIDRCCISVPVPKDKIYYNAIDQAPPSNYADLVRFYTDPEWILERSISKFENTYYGGEALPSIFPNFGTGGHAAYFNCKYEFAPDTIWFFPIINDWNTDKLQFNASNELLNIQKKVLGLLSKQGKGKFFVAMPDNCGSMDALAHLRGSDNLLLDMLEEPKAVKDAIKTVVNVLKSTGDEFFKITKENNDNGSCHGWMQTWSGGRHMQLQCDLSVMISPQMYEEFVLPELEETANWLDHAIYHLDGREQIRHLDMILSVKKINMIQWTPVAGQPSTTEFIPVLQRIQKAGKGLVLLPEVWEVEKLLSELSPKGLHLVVYGAKSETEAKDLIKLAEKMTR